MLVLKNDRRRHRRLAHQQIPADMPPMTDLVFDLKTEAETAAFGARLAPILNAGDVVCFEGPLGAGKSTLARGLIRAFCGAKDVPSPTFTLVETYEGASDAIWHFDLYRLDKQSEIWELGFEDAIETGISLIEWPDKIKDILPDGALRLCFDVQSDGARRLTLIAPDQWMPALRQAGIA